MKVEILNAALRAEEKVFFHYIWGEKNNNKKHSSSGLGKEIVCLYEKKVVILSTHTDSQPSSGQSLRQ